MPITTLLDIYNKSTAPRPTDSKMIPGNPVNFFDVTNTYAAGFTPLLKPGDPTQFTNLSLTYYDKELQNMVIPESFVRVDPSIPLNEYNYLQKYYIPGAGEEGNP